MRKVRQYTLEDTVLGTGGMGNVYKGATQDGKTVAVKEIKEEFAKDPEYRRRIGNEIGFLRKLNHPNIVHISDYFEENDSVYIVMDYVSGQNFSEYIERKGALSVNMAVDYMTQILGVMQYVHDSDVIHRDLKPSNVMIRDNGSGICLLDFGIAKDTHVHGGTETGTIIGTNGYMSPEQAFGLSIDHRTDIYSLGCLFFFMITGRHAYPQSSSESEIKIAMSQPFPRISSHKKRIPDVYQQIIDKATSKNMLHRYQSCDEFIDALKAVCNEKANTKEECYKVTIGRENCDIIFPDNLSVSRHHATIEFVNRDGQGVYFYTDYSTNGSKINEIRLTKGKACEVKVKAKEPEILLAGKIKLSWQEVLNTFKKKYPELSDTTTKTQTLSKDEMDKILKLPKFWRVKALLSSEWFYVSVIMIAVLGIILWMLI